MSIAIQALCNLIMRPSKYIDYADLAESRIELDELNALTARKFPWYKRDPSAKREKHDYGRFMNIVDKHIVFYSEHTRWGIMANSKAMHVVVRAGVSVCDGMVALLVAGILLIGFPDRAYAYVDPSTILSGA